MLALKEVTIKDDGSQSMKIAGNLLKMEIYQANARPTESKTLRLGSKIYFNKTPG